jgi:hypothetical protein
MVPIALGTAFRRWELSNLGFYCLFEFQKLHPTNPLGSIEIRGGGGGILKSVFPFLRSPLDMAGLDYPSALVGRLEREQRHFIAYRNRIHCGRIHGGSETVLWRWDPLTSLDAVLAANLAPRTMRARGQVHCDLLLLLGPHLADVEFDKPHKAFTPAMREASPFRQARPSLDIEPLALGTLAGSGLADPWEGPKPPQPWVPSEEFAARAREHLRAVCRDALPAVPALAGLLPVAERFADGPAPADLRNHARGVTKVYTLARLAQLGVEADPGAPRLRPDTPARRLLREASLRSRATLRRVLAGHGRG